MKKLTGTLISLWVGIVLCGIVQSQETPLEDTIHLFNTNSDTIRLEFEGTLRLSSLYDSADKEDWHYIYRWNTGARTAGIQVKFEGKRKILYIGQRFSAIHWPEEYDTFFSAKRSVWYATEPEEDSCIVCAPTIEADTVQYVWSDIFFSSGNLKILGTEQCIYAHTQTIDITSKRPYSYFLYCQATAMSKDGEPIEQVTDLSLDFDTLSGIKEKIQGETQLHNLNVWGMPRGTQIYARLHDTIRFFFERDVDHYPELEDYEFLGVKWQVYPDDLHTGGFIDSTIDIYFEDSLFLRKVLASTGRPNMPLILAYHYLYWGIKPNAEIESDSVWVFFPQYPYSNLGGRVDLCLPPDAPLPAAEDTMQVFNLGLWNRELDYVEYAWFDGTKDAMGRDSVVGTDSAFAYRFGRMDSVSPDLYAGMLVTRVAADSLWQDSCGCFVPCTDDACHRYDTVRIYLHRLPSQKQNLFLPQDTTLCAHRDLELILPDTANNYHCFWLDQDSVVLPYGKDTNRFTITGMHGTDGFGANTDTRNPRFLQLRLDHKLCGVSYFDTLLVYDQVKPAFELPFHDTVICLNEPVALDSLNPLVYRPFYAFEWNDGTKGSAYSFADSGTYILRFFVNEDFAVCGYDTASDTVHVLWSDPARTLISISDTSFCEKLSVTLDASVPYSSTRYSWQEGNLDDLFSPLEDSSLFTAPIIKVDKEVSLALFVVDTMGCVNTRQIAITEEDCKPSLSVPNVFTPNGDGVNDVLRLKQVDYCYDVDILIVDRKGSRVLHEKLKKPDDFSWNGCLNNGSRKLPDGAYFYLISYKNTYGKKKYQSGSITILGSTE